MKVNDQILNLINSSISEQNYTAFENELINVYETEKKVNVLLPKMIINAKSIEIVTAFEEYLKFGQEHLERLENLFKTINKH